MRERTVAGLTKEEAVVGRILVSEAAKDEKVVVDGETIVAERGRVLFELNDPGRN